MPSPVYQYVIHLVVSLLIWKGPGAFMNESVWEHLTLNKQIFYVANFIILTPLSLLS